MQYTHGRDRVFEVTEWACTKMMQFWAVGPGREVKSFGIWLDSFVRRPLRRKE